MPSELRISTASLITPFVEPHPIKVTSAPGSPVSFGGGTAASMPAILRCRFSIMARRIKRRCTDRGLAGGPDANRCNQFTAINFNVEIEILGIDGRPAFRQQQIRQNDSRTLEPVGEIVHFGNQLETIENIRGRRDD